MGIFDWFKKFTSDDVFKASESSDLPFKDAWEGYYYSDYDNKAVNIDIHISYVDIEKQSSKRDITAKMFWLIPEENEHFIYAYCHARKGNRTFRVSRIKELIVLDTGEVVPPENYLSFFKSEHEKTPEFLVSKILIKYESIINLAVFVSQSDGRFTTKEKNVLYEFIGTSENKPLSEAEINLLNKELKYIDVKQTKAKKSAKLIKESYKTDIDKVSDMLNKIVATTKKVNPVTEASLKVIQDILQ